MSVPEGYKVVGTQERTSRITGQVYSVDLLREAEPADAHVRAYERTHERTRRDAEREAKRVARRNVSELRKSLPVWNRAAKELQAIGFTQGQIADVFGVSLYAVRKMVRTLSEIEKERAKL